MLADQRQSWAVFAATMNDLLDPGAPAAVRAIGEKR